MTIAVLSMVLYLFAVQNVYAPDPDPCMEVENYKRSFEQNELLGLNDMKTENYTAETEK